MRAHSPYFIFSSLALLSACAQPNFVEPEAVLPNADKLITAPSVADIVNHIQCEVLRELRDNANAYKAITDAKYSGAANLTLEVSDNEGFNPSLTQYFPYKSPMTNFALSVNGVATGIQHRTYNLQFAVPLNNTLACDPPDPLGGKVSLSPAALHGLHGDLELWKILRMGMTSITEVLPDVCNKATAISLAKAQNL
jgi:hypothetical protein